MLTVLAGTAVGYVVARKPGKTKAVSRMEGWTCPRCGRAWSPMIPECRPCNVKREDEERQDTWKEYELEKIRMNREYDEEHASETKDKISNSGRWQDQGGE